MELVPHGHLVQLDGDQEDHTDGELPPSQVVELRGGGGADIRVLAFVPPPATRIRLPTPDSPVLNQASQTQASCLLMLSERQESTGVKHPFQNQTGWSEAVALPLTRGETVGMFC